MVGNPFPQYEQTRLAALRRYETLDTSPEPLLDHITALTAWFFKVPISAIDLILRDRILVKSLYGLEKAEIDRWPEWYVTALSSNDVFCIPNALEDPRAKADPLVAGEFGLRFYAAAPLHTKDGYCVGTLSVMDHQPREITVSEKEFLRQMAALSMELIEWRLAIKHLPTFIASAISELPHFAVPSSGKRLLPELAEYLAKALDAASGEKNQLEIPSNRFRNGFGRSTMGRSKPQQLAWLNKRIIGDSPAMHKVHDHLRLAIIKHADSVLLMGETGTGKGECALAIHEGSGTRGRFIEVNCGALPRDLIESELFGHEKGSFTGATSRKIGLFEQANGGTIFLDEIAELSPDLQVKLLSVLQARELRRVGGTDAIPINVRVIAATNRPLSSALQDGSFRRDLFFRIGSWRIELPPLRNRGDDVISLARHFLLEKGRAKSHWIKGLTPEAEALLKLYDWPGNVRQLINVIERTVILETGREISVEAVRSALEEEKKLFNPIITTHNVTDISPPADRVVRRILLTAAEVKAIKESLVRNHYNKTHAAKEIGLTRGQLEYRLKLIDR